MSSKIFVTKQEISERLFSKKPPKLNKRPRIVSTPALGVRRVSTKSGNISSIYDESINNSYLHQCFEILEKLGEGSFGVVYKAKSKEDNKLYAIKKLKVISRTYKNVLEVEKHELVPNHENCLRLYFAWEENSHVYMQLELCTISLETYATLNHNIPNEKLWNIFLDLLLAVKNLHDRNYLHLDIKPANILLSESGTCKLGDFGLLIDLTQDNYERKEGEGTYCAPELFAGVFTKAADIFSVGIVILELASDLLLPSSGDAWQLLRKGFFPSQCDRIDNELFDLVKWSMSPYYEDRPTVEQLLSHPKLKSLKRERQKRRILERILNFIKSLKVLLFRAIEMLNCIVLPKISPTRKHVYSKDSATPLKNDFNASSIFSSTLIKEPFGEFSDSDQEIPGTPKLSSRYKTAPFKPYALFEPDSDT